MTRATTATLGRWISIGAHPFVLVPLAILVSTLEGGLRVSGPILGVVVAAMVVLAVFVGRRLRRGEVTDVDISTRAQRPAFYAVAVACMASAAIALHFLGQGRGAVSGTAVSAGLLAAGAVANIWVKASLHVAFAALATGIVWGVSVPAVVSFAVATVLLAWGRVAYGRHTAAEVAVGLVLGTAAAVVYVVLGS